MSSNSLFNCEKGHFFEFFFEKVAFLSVKKTIGPSYTLSFKISDVIKGFFWSTIKILVNDTNFGKNIKRIKIKKNIPKKPVLPKTGHFWFCAQEVYKCRPSTKLKKTIPKRHFLPKNGHFCFYLNFG